MNQLLPVVELKTAYCWHCEECGRRNFCMPEKAEFGPGEREEAYREFHDLQEFEELPDGWEEFEMVWIPDVVICDVCGSKFRTEDECLPGEQI